MPTLFLCHLKGYLAFNLVASISPLSLLGHIPSLREFLSHLVPEVQLGPCDSDRVWCSVSSPWPMPLAHLTDMRTSSIARSDAEHPWTGLPTPPCFLEGHQMAIRLWPYSSWLFGHARAALTVLLECRFEARTLPLPDGRLTDLCEPNYNIPSYMIISVL